MTNSNENLPRSNRTSLASAMAPHYRAAIAMVHRLQMRHAAGLYASAKAAIALTASNIGSNLFRFLPLALLPAQSTNNKDDTSITSEDGVSANAPFIEQLNNGSSRLWSTPTCRPKRSKLLKEFFSQKSVEGSYS